VKLEERSATAAGRCGNILFIPGQEERESIHGTAVRDNKPAKHSHFNPKATFRPSSTITYHDGSGETTKWKHKDMMGATTLILIHGRTDTCDKQMGLLFLLCV
jgi:hypothetical protein